MAAAAVVQGIHRRDWHFLVDEEPQLVQVVHSAAAAAVEEEDRHSAAAVEGEEAHHSAVADGAVEEDRHTLHHPCVAVEKVAAAEPAAAGDDVAVP